MLTSPSSHFFPACTGSDRLVLAQILLTLPQTTLTAPLGPTDLSSMVYRGLTLTVALGRLCSEPVNCVGLSKLPDQTVSSHSVRSVNARDASIYPTELLYRLTVNVFKVLTTLSGV